MIFILIAVGICVADLLIKYWVEKKRTFADKSSILGGNIVIEKSHNKGACLNFMDKRPNYVLGITGVIFGILLCFFGYLLPKQKQGLMKLATSFLVGGVAGNFIDRMHRGYVVDYLNFPKIKRLKNIDFNISDMFLIVGGIIILLISLFSKEK